MNKTSVAALTAFILSAIESITVVWGAGWWSVITEEFIAVIITLITPLVMWFFVSRAP